MEYDIFISHASDDKQSFVEPLANALKITGLKVWYDRFELKLGDSLREKIDQGLANSKYGVVILSKSFFAKEWPKSELDALVTRQNNEGKKVILPIWHNVDAEEVKKFSPILASKLAARSTDGIEAVIAQIVDVCRENASKPTSVFQVSGNFGLREQCLEIIRQNDIIAWRKMISNVSGTIPDKLKTWKSEGETAVNQGKEAWVQAVMNAAQICLPGFVPIFAAVEAGKLEYWKESVVILRRLALLEAEMGGGSCAVLEIGGSLLSVAGFLGLSIATSLKLFDFVNEWMYLKLPGRMGSNAEIMWINYHKATSTWFDPKEPFSLLTKLSQTELLKGFFDNPDRLVGHVFVGNLLSSLVELRLLAIDQGRREALLSSHENIHPHVIPYWPFMKCQQLSNNTLYLFGDSYGVYNYVFPNQEVSIDNFWKLWKQWKTACAHIWYPSYDFFELKHFSLLPGEPA